MADYSPSDAEYAATIVQRLIAGEAYGLEIEQDLAISDLESNANKFSEDLALLEDFNQNFPAVIIGNEKVPVAIGHALGLSDGWPPFSQRGIRRFPYWRRDPNFYEEIFDLLRLTEDSQLDGFTSMSREDARSTFTKRATDFLATRLAAVRGFRNREFRQDWQFPTMLTFRQLLGGSQVATPGCNFTVTTNSGGLRVFWSGAYYVTPHNFNHPTTPTSSVLQSGTYIFGVDGGAYGNKIQWYLNLVVSLPGIPQAHLNY
jgi:hypothetical protein